MKIIEPVTEKEIAAYNSLRYEILRKPWNQPLEHDDSEKSAIHAMLVDNNNYIGVGRLHLIDADTAQIRGMGIDNNYRRQNLGVLIMNYLEQKAKENNVRKIFLHAREEALNFYTKCGYKNVEKSHLMWGQIQHFLMEKIL